jgi:hypothetical protein
MDKSEILIEKLKKVENDLEAVRARQRSMLRDPALTDLILELVVAERVLNPNHERIKEIHGELRIRKEIMEKELKEVENEMYSIACRLQYLTTPVIEKCVSELTRLQSERKLERNILDKSYDGLRKKWVLKIFSNERAVSLVRNLGQKGVAKLESMRFQPIKEIEEAFEQSRVAIEEIDCERFDTLTVNEEEYFRGGPPPQGSVGNYSGSLTGMPMPPLQKPLSVEEAKTGSKWPFGRED